MAHGELERELVEIPVTYFSAGVSKENPLRALS